MKTMLFSVLTFIALTACGNAPKKQSTDAAPKNCVEVLSFHGKQRCATCIAIEKSTKEVVEKEFAQQIKDGKIYFRIIDISKPENEALADKYEVTWSSLLINKLQDGEETVNNLTEFAFANARSNPEKFKVGLKAEIEKLLTE